MAGANRCSTSSRRSRTRFRDCDASIATRWPRFDHRLYSSERDFFDMFRFLFLTRVLNRGADRAFDGPKGEASPSKWEASASLKTGQSPVEFSSGTDETGRLPHRTSGITGLHRRSGASAPSARPVRAMVEMNLPAPLERANGRLGKMRVLGSSVLRGAVSSDRAKDRSRVRPQLLTVKRDLRLRSLGTLERIFTPERDGPGELH